MLGKHKAIVLLSGGLDSILAVKRMIDQGIDIDGRPFYQPLLQSNI
jgi:tRNA U34 2-thiouridine synthase MnmA/TrmU